MTSMKLAFAGPLGLALLVACEVGGGSLPPQGSDASSETGDDAADTEASGESESTDAMVSATASTHAADTAPDDDGDAPNESGSSGEASDPDPPAPPAAVCAPTGGCFDWCGTAFADGSCHRAEDTELDASAFGPAVCAPLELAVDGGVAWPVEDSDDERVRCFLQVLRYGNVGVAELHFRDTASERHGHLVVQGFGDGYARLELRLDGVDPACGDAIAMSAPAAHVRAERDPLFDACLDTNDDVDAAACVLGPAATFFADHDWIHDVAFPWLTGSCSVP